MEKQKSTQLLVIAILAVAVLTMSVGFAAFSAQLNIDGNVTVKAASWNVHIDVADPISGTVTKTTKSEDITVTSATGTNLAWSTTLTEPGDYAEFTFDVVNEGTFDANLTGIQIGGLTTAQSKYTTYEVTLGSNKYTSTTTGLTTKLDKTNGTHTYTVKVTYVQPTDATDLPTSDATLNLTLGLTYAQIEPSSAS